MRAKKRTSKEVRLTPEYLADLDRQVQDAEARATELRKLRDAARLLLGLPVATNGHDIPKTMPELPRRASSDLAGAIRTILANAARPLTAEDIRHRLVDSKWPGARPGADWTHSFNVLRALVDKGSLVKEGRAYRLFDPDGFDPATDIEQKTPYRERIRQLLIEADRPMRLIEMTQIGAQRWGETQTWNRQSVKWALKRRPKEFEKLGSGVYALVEWPEEKKARHRQHIRAIGA